MDYFCIFLLVITWKWMNFNSNPISRTRYCYSNRTYSHVIKTTSFLLTKSSFLAPIKNIILIFLAHARLTRLTVELFWKYGTTPNRFREKFYFFIVFPLVDKRKWKNFLMFHILLNFNQHHVILYRICKDGKIYLFSHRHERRSA